MAANAGASTGSETGSAAAQATPGFDAAFDAAMAEAEGASEDGGGAGDETDEPPDDSAEDATETDDETADADADGESAESDDASSTDQDATDETADGEEADAAEQDPHLAQLLKATPKEAHEAIRKQWGKAFTPRSQELAQHERFLKAFQRDPEAAAREVLARAEARKPVTLPDSAEIAQVLISKGVKAEDAQAQAEALSAVLKPLQDHINEQAAIVAADAGEAEYNRFTKEFPDAKEGGKLYDRMNALADEIQPAPGTTVYDFMKHLRSAVLGNVSVAERVRKTIKTTLKNAKAKGPTTRPVPSSTVQPGAGKLLSMEQSFEMALRGETVGRGIRK